MYDSNLHETEPYIASLWHDESLSQRSFQEDQNFFYFCEAEKTLWKVQIWAICMENGSKDDYGILTHVLGLKSNKRNAFQIRAKISR